MTLSVPQSNKITLALNIPQVIVGSSVPTSIHLTTGSNIQVEYTLAQGPDIDAGTADWFPWPDGSKAGPYIGIIERCTAIQLTELAAVTSTAYTMR